MKPMKHFFLILLFGCVCTAGLSAQSGDSAVKAVLFPFREAVISSRVDSTLEPYRFLVGEKFKKGSEIVRLDDRRFALEVKRIGEQCEFSRLYYEDQKKLYAQKFTSEFELKKREFEYRALQTNLEEAKLNVSYCVVVAPFDGKIEELMTRDYETVRAGQPLFRMIDDNQLLAVMNIPMQLEDTFRPGAEVSLSIPESRSKTAVGKVYEVMPRADHRSGTIRIKVLIDNRSGAFTAGMTGDLIPPSASAESRLKQEMPR